VENSWRINAEGVKPIVALSTLSVDQLVSAITSGSVPTGNPCTNLIGALSIMS
jgi:hypothetical protein